MSFTLGDFLNFVLLSAFQARAKCNQFCWNIVVNEFDSRQNFTVQ
jgi:hypothetical protein